jgi:hypothetical protein
MPARGTALAFDDMKKKVSEGSRTGATGEARARRNSLL